MKQGQFEQLYGDIWFQFESMLDLLEDKKSKTKPDEIENFAHLYRKVCHFHALAKSRDYSSFLVDHLADLTVRGHQHLYQRKYPIYSMLLRFVVQDFPALVRREQKLFWIATALLYLPGLIYGIAVVVSPELIYTVMGPEQVLRFEDMYDPANRVLGSARDSETNWQMFGFYINNNISVAFRTFASGLLWGVGSVFFLVYNGFLMGAAAAHLINVEYSQTFFTFVIAHGSFELTAIVIAGAAGLKLGLSLLNPGSLTRIESLRNASKTAIQLVYGVILMLVIAAFIEAFWSSNNVFLPWQKYLVGSFLWLVVVGYLVFSGRRYEP